MRRKVGDAALVRRRDLAVEHDLTAELRQLGEHRAEVPAALIAVARQHANAAAAVGDDGEPMAVMLDLEQPAVARGRAMTWRAGRRRGAVVVMAVAPYGRT
jgi:hypothetical protein